MKEIIILILVLLLVFIPNFYFQKFLSQSGNELIEIVNLLQNKMKEEVEVKKEDAIALKEMFYEKEKIWILIVDHDMLDEIEYAVEDSVALYTNETHADFFAASNRLKDEIEDLAKREEISFANIL